MTQKVRCRACRGIYLPVQDSGHVYYHVCPLLSEAEVARLDPFGVDRLKPGTQRPNHRDERPLPGVGTRPARPRSEGSGVEEYTEEGGPARANVGSTREIP